MEAELQRDLIDRFLEKDTWNKSQSNRVEKATRCKKKLHRKHQNMFRENSNLVELQISEAHVGRKSKCC